MIRRHKIHLHLFVSPAGTRIKRVSEALHYWTPASSHCERKERRLAALLYSFMWQIMNMSLTSKRSGKDRWEISEKLCMNSICNLQLPLGLSFVPQHKTKQKAQKQDNRLLPTVPFVLVSIQVNYYAEPVFFSPAASAYSCTTCALTWEWPCFPSEQLKHCCKWCLV